MLPGSIVPATGAIASRDARVSQEYNRVQELRSDLKSETKQLRVGISPQSFSQRYNWSLNYTIADVREQYRGFQSTTGNPRDVAWSRAGGESRHQITYNLFYNFFDAVRVNWFGQVRSGSPFTPGIAGDVNGDGYSNDRAFVYDPAKTADPALADGDADADRQQHGLGARVPALAARRARRRGTRAEGRGRRTRT